MSMSLGCGNIGINQVELEARNTIAAIDQMINQAAQMRLQMKYDKLMDIHQRELQYAENLDSISLELFQSINLFEEYSEADMVKIFLNNDISLFEELFKKEKELINRVRKSGLTKAQMREQLRRGVKAIMKEIA